MNVRKANKPSIQTKQQCYFEQKKENILQNKLDFLKVQLLDSQKRILSLRQANKYLKTAFADIAAQQSNLSQTPSSISQSFLQDTFQSNNQSSNLTHQHIVPLKSIMNKNISELQNRYKKQQNIDNRKIQQLEVLISEYKLLCEVALNKRKVKVQNESKNESLVSNQQNNSVIGYKINKNSKNSFQKKKKMEFQNSNNKENMIYNSVATYRQTPNNKKTNKKDTNQYDIKQKSISNNINRSVSNLNNLSCQIRKSYEKYINTSMRITNSNHRLLAVRNNSKLNFNYQSSDRAYQPKELKVNDSLNDSKSYSTNRLKGQKSYTKIITKIKCEGCDQNFGPNQYYRHLQKCIKFQKIKLMQEKQNLSIKLKDILDKCQ